MKAIKLLGLFGSFTLLLGIIACGQKQDSKEPSRGKGEQITLNLDLKCSVNNDMLKAISHQMETNSSGDFLPKRKLQNGDIVMVHVCLRNPVDGYILTKTMPWIYHASEKSLVLRGEGANIEFDAMSESAFYNPSFQWYISAFIGGELDEARMSVRITPNRQLKGINPSSEDKDLNIEIPYSTGWMPLDIQHVPTSSLAHPYEGKAHNLVFKPVGAVIGYKMKNGFYETGATFKPTGFVVTTDAFSDEGEFSLSSMSSAFPPAGEALKWTPKTTGNSLKYSFLAEHETLNRGATSELTYYAWVMPNPEVSTLTEASTTIITKGEAQGTLPSNIPGLRSVWRTDYKPHPSTRGKVTSGKVYRVTVNTLNRFRIPIEYVGEYYLAGGYSREIPTSLLSQDPYNGQQPDGVQGPFRLTARNVYNPQMFPNFRHHLNCTQAGFYSWYQIAGVQHPIHNPSGRALLDTHELYDEYGISSGYFGRRIPDFDETWAIAIHNINYYFGTTSFTSGFVTDNDKINVGGLHLNTSSEITGSKPFGSNHSIIYGIRFKKQANNQPAYAQAHNEPKRTYAPVQDDFMKCAYRYVMYEGRDRWNSLTHEQEKNKMFVVNVVYLGNEETPTPLDDGSPNCVASEAWWDAKRAAGEVITRYFPAYGYLSSDPSWAWLPFKRAPQVLIPSKQLSSLNQVFGVYTDGYRVYTYEYTPQLDDYIPVLPFRY